MSDGKDADCEWCGTGVAVLKYAKVEIAALARRAIYQLQRLPAVGVYGDARPFRTQWDEYCHEIQHGPYERLEGAWEATLAVLHQHIAEAIPPHEAALLTLAARWDEDVEQDSWVGKPPAVDTGLIQRIIRKHVAYQAGMRDMSRFDPWG